MDYSQKNTVLITCGPSLAEALETELTDLGFTAQNVHPGGIEISATFDEATRLNLQLRTAYNVLYLLKHFRANKAEELYKQASSIPWEEIIPSDQYMTVVSRVDTPSITNSMFPNLKLKDAIVDRLLAKTGSRPDSGPERNRIVINLFWKNDRCWIYLNLSGNKLSDRNYRKIPFTAPMREVLAAAVIKATDYHGQCQLINPMCGSGTLAIEAALIAANRPAGILRTNFGFMHTIGFDSEKWQQTRVDVAKQAKKQAKKMPPPKPIIATDIDPAAIDAAHKNAMTAGVEHLIHFDVCDFAETQIPEEPGIIIMNPEYGERLGEIRQLEETYERIGDFFKQKCQGYNAYVFTGNRELAKRVGLRTSRKIIFFNADIECRLLKYQMYAGTKKIRDDDQQKG